MNAQPVNANAQGTSAKLKPGEVAPVNPNRFVSAGSPLKFTL